jgi:hypothetical protein
VITLAGEVLTALGHRHGQTWACSALEVRHEQAPIIPLNLEHDRELQVGEVVGLHRHGDSLWAICEAGADRLLGFDQPLFYSVEGSARAADGGDVVIEGLALCTQPRHVAVQSVRLYAGGAREAIRCTNWSSSDRFCRRLLEQAVEQRHQRKDGPITISYPPIDEYVHRDAIPQQREHHTGRGHGPVRWSAPYPGSIISVR